MKRKTALLFLVLNYASFYWSGEGLAQAVTPDGRQPSADAKVVRQLLDRNGFQSTSVSQVAKERDGRIVELTIRGNKMTDKSLRVILPEIGKLDKLEKLVLASNELRELPDSIYGLINLKELDLSNNGLESLSLKIRQLKHLQKLKLSMNRLVEIPASIGELSELTQLDLMSNQIRGLPEGIGALSKLEYLGLRSNLVSGLPASMAKLKRLNNLDLTANRLKEVPDFVYGFRTLQRLYLSNNEIQKLSPLVGSLDHLESLTLDHNKVTSLPDEMQEMAALEYFSIDANLIEDIDATLKRVFPGDHKPRMNKVTQDLSPRQATDSAFTISKAPPLPDGRPVIDIKPNGKNRPEGTGPSGSYYLVVRQNGRSYYLRWFSPEEAAIGTQYDLDIPSIGLDPGDKLTVGVENINNADGSQYTKLSNILDVPHPPAPSPAKDTSKQPK